MKFVYEIGGNGNDARCRFELQDMAECSYDWGCKCQDSRNNTYTCLRSVTQTEDSLFCQFSDDKNTEEFYDLHTDPYQLHNLAAAADLAAAVDLTAAAATGHEHHSQNTRLVFLQFYSVSDFLGSVVLAAFTVVSLVVFRFLYLRASFIFIDCTTYLGTDTTKTNNKFERKTYIKPTLCSSGMPFIDERLLAYQDAKATKIVTTISYITLLPKSDS
jgi:hypothetical protein